MRKENNCWNVLRQWSSTTSWLAILISLISYGEIKQDVQIELGHVTCFAKNPLNEN